MTTATKMGWWRFFLAAAAAALVALFGAGTASAATLSVVETRVGASTPTASVVVGPHECITAGQHWVPGPSQLRPMSGHCVAANGGRVFWSGGDMAKDAAATFARDTGGRTLELTRTGKTLEWLTDKTSYNLTKPLWDRASARFANGASGEAHVFFGPGAPSPMSIYSTIENPILQRNGVSIVSHWAWSP